MSTQQKALLLTSKHGEFAVGTIDLPAAAPDELLVKVEAAGVNPVEWKIQLSGLIIEEYPAVLGLEGAGTVEAVGEGVSGFTKGDRVLFPGAFYNRHSTYKQYAVVKAEFTAKIPDVLSFEQAATIPVALTTAAFSLFNQDKGAAPSTIGLSPPWETDGRGKYAGKPLVVLGAASSVGQSALQLAKLAGFSPVIATASLHNATLLKELGATHVVDRHLAVGALRAEIVKITSASIDLVFDAVSTPDTQGVGYELLSPGGQLVLVIPTLIPAEGQSADKAIKNAMSSPQVPFNAAAAASLFRSLPALLTEGVIKPNRVEVVPGGFSGVAGGLEKLRQDQVSARKLVVRPFDTV